MLRVTTRCDRLRQQVVGARRNVSMTANRTGALHGVGGVSTGTGGGSARLLICRCRHSVGLTIPPNVRVEVADEVAIAHGSIFKYAEALAGEVSAFRNAAV